jgi:thioredoxin reductase
MEEEVFRNSKSIDGSDVVKTDQNDDNNIIDDMRNQNAYEYNDIFDVAIIGAGFAGLSAALLLGRYLRPTVIFNGGDTRNSMSKHVHGYLGFENFPPRQFIQKAWADVLQYDSVKVIKEKVDKIERYDQLFLLKTEGGRRSVKAKYIIIATGILDVKPKIINFEKFDGSGLWHCPHCDGFQSTNKRLAIITSKKNDPLRYAKEFLGWTKEITLFMQDDQYRLTDNERNEPKDLGIDIVENDEVIEIVGNQRGFPEGVICKSGKFYDTEVIFYHLGYSIQNHLAKQVGCELDEGYIKINAMHQTTVPNVYAAGDIDTDRHYVVLAAASGALAAISIYEKILKDAIRMVKIS